MPTRPLWPLRWCGSPAAASGGVEASGDAGAAEAEQWRVGVGAGCGLQCPPRGDIAHRGGREPQFGALVEVVGVGGSQAQESAAVGGGFDVAPAHGGGFAAAQQRVAQQADDDPIGGAAPFGPLSALDAP